MDVLTENKLQDRTRSLLKALAEGLYERDTAIRLSFLSTIAGESIFLLGPPGVGKSLIARRLKYAFSDGTNFEYLMSKFSTPDEIFGPISIKKLKEEDKYERLTDRYLPGANIVFLDEIWKAGPAIQNALLTILNEKIYRNGDQDMQVNIRGIITASNELPPRNKSLEPIWDRFLVRLEVGKIRSFQNLVDMMVSTDDVYEDRIPQELKLTKKELDAFSIAIDEVEVPPEVLNTLQLVMYKIETFNEKPNNQERQIKVYDRRWKKIIRLLRTSAYLNDRQQVDLMDCFLMEHCLWSYPDHRELVREMITDAVRKHGYSLAINLSALKQEVSDFEKDVDQETRIRNVIVEDQLLPIHEKYYQLEKVSTQFKGALISIEQFRQLETSEDQVINFYDNQQNLINRIKTRKGDQENTIVTNFNGQLQRFALSCQQQERTEIIYKKPHPVVVQFWDERCERLMHYIIQQQAQIRAHETTSLSLLEAHLFVDAQWAEVVKANLEEVQRALQNLHLRLEKIQYSYAEITAH